MSHLKLRPAPPRPRSVFLSADRAAHLVALPFKTRSPGAHLRAGASAGRRKRRHRRLPALPPHPPGPPAATMSASAVFILDVKGKVRLGAGNGRPTAGGCSLSDPACGPSLQAARFRKALGAWEHPSPNSWDSGVEPHLHCLLAACLREGASPLSASVSLSVQMGITEVPTQEELIQPYAVCTT